MIKSVLVVSPRFPPTNAADCHRVRLSVRHYQKFGWRPIILCSMEIPAKADDWRLYSDVAKSVKIIRIRPWNLSLCRRFGFGQIEFRSFFPMLAAGLKIIREEKVMIAFFSTTAFTIFLLGPVWRLLTGVCLVYDIQDPWYHGRQLPYSKHNSPGSWRKYKTVQLMAKHFEPIAFRNAAQIISVSKGYIETMTNRYAIPREKFTLLPFPGAYEDFALAKDAKQQLFAQGDGKMHWVYAGRAGPDVAPTIRSFFKALLKVAQRRSSLRGKLQIHFVGTNYAPENRTYDVVSPIAFEEGVHGFVSETSERIGYLEVLDLYQSADVILLFGSNNPEYTASKIVNCILAERPLFAVFHQDSLVREILQQTSSCFGTFYSSKVDEHTDSIAAEIERVLDSPSSSTLLTPEVWLASENARIQCQVFDKAISE